MIALSDLVSGCGVDDYRVTLLILRQVAVDLKGLAAEIVPAALRVKGSQARHGGKRKLSRRRAGPVACWSSNVYSMGMV
jgi:hypothetical protein